MLGLGYSGVLDFVNLLSKPKKFENGNADLR